MGPRDYREGTHIVRRFSSLLEDTDSVVRENACWALGYVGDDEAIPALKYVAGTDDDADVRERASWALARIEY